METLANRVKVVKAVDSLKALLARLPGPSSPTKQKYKDIEGYIHAVSEIKKPEFW